MLYNSYVWIFLRVCMVFSIVSRDLFFKSAHEVLNSAQGVFFKNAG